MKNHSLKKNYFYNLIYQIFLIIVPIFVTPYVSRVLLSDGIGKYSFTNSIVSYFSLFAAFGFTIYGQKIVAKYQNDQENLTKSFFEILICRLITGLFSITIYIVVVSFQWLGSKYTLLMWINLLTLIGTVFDINFLFYGCEEFKTITIRNLIFKILSIVSIFLFVKTHDDLWKYVLIQVGFTFLSTLSFWFIIRKKLCKIKFHDLHPLKHFKPALMIFIPSIAVSIYTVLDKTIIGFITKSDDSVGNYENAEKIVKLALTVITSLSTVYVSRNAYLFKNGEINQFKKNINILISFVTHISIPMFLGIFVVSSNLIPWYLGNEYGESNWNEVILMMKILSPIIVFIGFSHIIGDTIEIAVGNEKAYLISTTCAALVNLVLNIILINFCGAIGACISTVVAEFLCVVLHIIFNKNYLSLKEVVKKTVKPLISSVFMTFVCILMEYYLKPSILNTLLIVITGVFVYASVLLVFRDEFVLTILSFIKNKIKNHKKDGKEN